MSVGRSSLGILDNFAIWNNISGVKKGKATSAGLLGKEKLKPGTRHQIYWLFIVIMAAFALILVIK